MMVYDSTSSVLSGLAGSAAKAPVDTATATRSEWRFTGRLYSDSLPAFAARRSRRRAAGLNPRKVAPSRRCRGPRHSLHIAYFIDAAEIRMGQRAATYSRHLDDFSGSSRRHPRSQGRRPANVPIAVSRARRVSSASLLSRRSHRTPCTSPGTRKAWSRSGAGAGGGAGEENRPQQLAPSPRR